VQQGGVVPLNKQNIVSHLTLKAFGLNQLPEAEAERSERKRLVRRLRLLEAVKFIKLAKHCHHVLDGEVLQTKTRLLKQSKETFCPAWSLSQ